MIRQAWRCELALWKTFWLLHIGGTVLAVLATIGLAVAGAAALNVTMDGAILLASVLIVALAILWSLFSLFLVWGNAANTPHRPWTLLAQGYVIFNVLYMLLSFFA
jgi:hypothetical protein